MGWVVLADVVVRLIVPVTARLAAHNARLGSAESLRWRICTDLVLVLVLVHRPRARALLELVLGSSSS
ncbi:MAG: hypothetical protein CVU63_05660 [Deltaproteobacteria bacterium HGW-Deltaproteobacteria-20]|jgi:hypothetical protein|nr:MAG: hypothetical protein CVU63_05660 [Deltaproteobacteria bacterium HGW-Deltaproteobacteria-20]